MLRTKRRTAGNLTALLLGIGGMIACVSGTTENPGDDGAAVCEPACGPGLVCDNGTCVPPTATGGTGAGGGPTGGTGGANGGQPTGGASGSGVGGGGNEGGIGGTNAGAGGSGNGGSGAVSGAATGGVGNTGGQGGSVVGGMGGTGGTGGTAGSSGTAGKGGTAGSSGTAGKGGTGGSSGTAGKGGTGGTGQAGATSCNIGGNHSGDGSFTWYHFSQGTGQESGSYVTACGYRAPTSGTSGTQDTVTNIANNSPASNHYFVAIPAADPQNFDSAIYCGACVELTGMNGQRIVATVVDMCPISGNPRCSQGAHLDVSKTAFDQLGFTRGDPTGTTWRFVPCPITGNVKVRMKSGNNNEFFVEGGITSITNVSVNGTAASRTFYGAWHVNSAISHPATLNLTDKAGRQLTVTLNNGTSDQDTGQQFPRCQ